MAHYFKYYNKATNRTLLFQLALRRKKRYIVVLCVCVLFKIFYFFSNTRNYPTVYKSYEKGFNYPLDVKIEPLVADILENRVPSVEPINYYSDNFLILSYSCFSLPYVDLIIAVRSSIKHFERRNAIRKTYGKAGLVPGKVVRTIFFVGDRVSQSWNIENELMQGNLGREAELYKDIIEASLQDNYLFNTIEMMTAFWWLYEHCPNAKFSLFTDDDNYISPANLLRYLDSWEEKINKTESQDRRLLAGKVIPKFIPQRDPAKTWYLPFELYPWDGGPPFADGRAFVVSIEAVQAIFGASLFVRHLAYEDVYIGIIAQKIGIRPTHCSQFYFFDKKLKSRPALRDAIACQGFGKPKRLIAVWNKTMRSRNNLPAKKRYSKHSAIKL